MEQLTTADGQQVVMQTVQGVSPQQVQVMQMNTGQMIQGANGQQIMVHTVPQTGQIQVASAGGQSLQQIQVLPVSSLQTAQGQVLLQQPQQAQILQTADGQTFIYQPMAIDSSTIQQQTQPTVLNINGNLVQIANAAPQQQTTAGNGAQQTVQATVQQSTAQTIVHQQQQQQGTSAGATSQLAMANGNLVMVRNATAAPDVPTTSGGQFQRVPIPGTEFLEEEPLYVNAKQYRRILKRRQARAKLESEGKIPKERPVLL